jgi:hypothetical protein
MRRRKTPGNILGAKRCANILFKYEVPGEKLVLLSDISFENSNFWHFSLSLSLSLLFSLLTLLFSQKDPNYSLKLAFKECSLLGLTGCKMFPIMFVLIFLIGSDAYK